MRIDFPKVPSHLEIERRYLLATPPPLSTPALVHARPSQIVQHTLRPLPGFGSRSRARQTKTPDGKTVYHWAAKQKQTSLTKTEAEIQIDQRTFNWLLNFSLGEPLRKTRWRFKIDGMVYELDHIREPQEHWLLEVELESEDQTFTLPAFLDIQEELT